MLQKPDSWGILFNIFKFFLNCVLLEYLLHNLLSGTISAVQLRFTVVLGLECNSWHILDMFLLFQRPSAARCCRKTLAMVCTAAIATVLLKKILWDRRRYHWRIRVSWLRFWNHDVYWKPAKQIVGENTAVPLMIITLISTLIWLFYLRLVARRPNLPFP